MKFPIKIAVLLGVFVLPLLSPAQMRMKKANKYFEQEQYAKAIPLYKKSARGKKREEAWTRLADCYRITKNYVKAEQYYQKLAAMKSANPMVYFYYAEVLLNLGKYDEAKKQYEAYAGMKPDDNRSKLYIRSCEQVKTWTVQPSIYKVYNLGDINTPVSDFSPVLYKDGIVFVSEAPKDLVNYSKNTWTGNPYYSIIFSKGSKEKDSVTFKKGKPLSSTFSNDMHNSSACFNKDGSEIYFTRVELRRSKKKGFVNRPRIYTAKAVGGKWKFVKPLELAGPEYSIAHPALSPDGQTLYFSSDMPGGQGGSDIWMSKKTGDSWGAPVNLGSSVNSQGDEAFPTVGEDGTLYFASSGWIGFGGFDIYSASSKDGIWSKPVNMLPPINSTADDFGIVFKDRNSGYFSSNRSGGKGADDIYGFTLAGKTSTIAGKILKTKNSSDGAPNATIMLLNEKGELLNTTTTDQTGFFKFENMSADSKYMIKLDETDATIATGKKYYLADDQNKVVRVTVKSEKGFFVFENLPSDLSKLSTLLEEDSDIRISIAGSLLAGDDKAPLANTIVNLTDENGQVLQSTTTNSFGTFAFTNLPSDKTYTLNIDNTDASLKDKKIYFVNKSGKEIAVNEKGNFKFTILASDKTTLQQITVKDDDLRVEMKGKILTDQNGKPLANTKVVLVNEQGQVLQTGMTDASGGFSFVNLPADQKFMVQLDETDSKINVKGTYYVTDATGKVIGKMNLKSGTFKFEVLPSEQKSLTNIYVDDPWLDVLKLKNTKKSDSITVVENIYFDYGSWDLLDEARITLDKVVKVMKADPNITIDVSAFTDSRGTDEFNMNLSEKRAQAAVDYIVSKGIDKKRITGKGYGESKILNKCKDGVDCSEEDHAQNRRTEFKIVKVK
ncbi:MAG: OmpA family protein [Bacteroidota bacterium]